MYIPKPIDTTDVILSEEVLELLETLAVQVHETWSSERLAEGWVYGEKRDDEKKQTPCLVSYDELPEIEKEYDRNTVLATLKLITKLGYDIRKSK